MDQHGDSRTRLLDATTALLADRGFHGTGMKDILGSSHVVAGSLYHHFPGGKDELAAACVQRAAREVADRMDDTLHSQTLVDAVEAFYAASAATLEASGYRTGCPVGTPAAETVTLTEPMVGAVAEAFREWEAVLSGALLREGWPDGPARATGSALLCLFEGALLVSRAQRSTAPLEAAGRASVQLVRAGPTA
jgi:TetR/AcrR family transcriptional regulator, lmrAB and yxaGH operons repressor